MKTPEAFEKADIDKYLEWCGAYVVKPTTSGYGESGHSDRVVCMRGHFLVIEVKREGKEPTALQWRRIAEARAAGGMPFWGTAKKVIHEICHWRQVNGLSKGREESEAIGRILRSSTKPRSTARSPRSGSVRGSGAPPR